MMERNKRIGFGDGVEALREVGVWMMEVRP